MKKLALLLLAAPLVFAACGGASSSLQVDPLAYVKRSAQKTADLPSEQLTMTGSMELPIIGMGPATLKMTGSGDFANASKQGQMTMSVAEVAGQRMVSQRIQMDAVIDGATMYVRSPLLGSFMQSPLSGSQLENGKSWVKVDLQKAEAANGVDYSSVMSQSPTQALHQLEAAGSVESIGTEMIDGVATTHYQVTNLDLSKLPQGAKIEALAHPKYGPIDVWIGNKDGYVYRESFSLSYSAAGKSPSVSMQVDLSKFGEKVNVAIPPASKVFDATSLASGGQGR